MTARSRDDLWRQLCDAGLAQGDLPVRSAPASPWFVRAMLGVAGWIGALFLLGFVGVGLAFVFKNEAVALVVGLLCCGASYVIFARAGQNVLASQFGLAISLAGQVMVVYGLFEGSGLNDDSPFVFLLIAIFEAALAYYLANFIHRVWSSFAAAVAFGFAMNMLGLYGVGVAIVGAALATIWLHEDDWAARGSFWRAIGWGLVFAFVQPMSYLSDGEMGRWTRPDSPAFTAAWIPWIKSILIAGLLVYVVYRLLEKHGVALPGTTATSALVASGVVGAATLQAQGIASTLIVVLLGFAGGNRALYGFGIFAMLSYLAYFYYSLQATLLEKSMALAGTGVALIALWLVMRFMFPEAPAKERSGA